MTDALSSSRPCCSACLRPRSTCICQWVAPVRHAVEVVILQHPLEVHQAKGSGRLLHLSLPHSALAVGETFDESLLHGLLHRPLARQRENAALPLKRQAVLLYPDTPQSGVQQLMQPPLLDPMLMRDPSHVRLIVLDATWRKSRKMLYLNPLLQQLPRLALTGLPSSRYFIRKAHRPDQLSTLEATCHALMQLEHNEEKFQPLLQAFDGFVAQQERYRQPRA